MVGGFPQGIGVRLVMFHFVPPDEIVSMNITTYNQPFHMNNLYDIFLFYTSK